MDKNDITVKLTESFGPAILKTDDPDGIVTFTVKADAIIPVVSYLKTQLGFIFLTDLCGIHYPDQEAALGVIYHLHNMSANIRLRLKAFVPVSKPSIASLTDLFPAANWMERETFDFYGILFEGHPNFKRILNVDYLDYFPMRKEYPLEDPTRHDKDDTFFGR
jgi:NADH-quinone oxidoreductase subunit C